MSLFGGRNVGSFVTEKELLRILKLVSLIMDKTCELFLLQFWTVEQHLCCADLHEIFTHLNYSIVYLNEDAYMKKTVNYLSSVYS